MDLKLEVAKAFLSASVQTLLDNITSPELRDFIESMRMNVSLLDVLEINLLMLDAILNDAEEKQITDHAFKKWLQELQDAVFDAEDLLDEINTVSHRCKMAQDHSQHAIEKVKSFFSNLSSEFNLGMNYKLRTISQKLEAFAKQKDMFRLQSFSLRVHKTPTTSLVNESVLVGRNEDKKKLLNLLKDDKNEESSGIGVITIWGMGGLGKTTLAQLLYNDKEVHEHFDLKAWACVSDDFNALEVTKNLVESLTSIEAIDAKCPEESVTISKTHRRPEESATSSEANDSKSLIESVTLSKAHDSNSLEFLRRELKTRLRDKKFLIVLDDLWNEKYSDWDNLVTPFRSGKRGSRIIVTTRQQRVAEITQTFPVYKLTGLSNEDCWCLLAKHALRNQDPNKYPELEAIGRKIAIKCAGLPIAARSIGGLLRSKVDAKEWEKIMKSNLWDFPNDDVLPALRLSYLYLPSHLKKCFAYCSIFPKNHILDKKQLALLWMAVGFIQQYSHGEKTLEAEADDYFNELLSRSFIQQHEANPKEFVMHDLINDLAKVVSGKSCLWFEGNTISDTVRHLSYAKQEYDGFKRFENFHHLNRLRTLLSQPLSSRTNTYALTKKVIHDLLPKLKCLRALSLSGYSNVTGLPNSVGNLQHLRYLDLSHTPIKTLPEKTFTLYNLQTLLLSYCRKFKELPKEIGKLINLRHLDINGTALKEVPTEITKLQNLQSLSTFVVGQQPNGLGIKELKKLPHLQGKLSILKLQNIVYPMDAQEANLKRREKIDELVLEWDMDLAAQRPMDLAAQRQHVENVLNMLQPSTNLERLTINHYGGSSFPTWVGDSSFTNISFLCMSNCNHCPSLPPVGQLASLKELLIEGMKSVHKVDHEFYGCKPESSSFQPFPSLEILKFENMEVWKEWIPFKGKGANFPFLCLKHLKLNNCPELRDVPSRLPSLAKVDILNCEKLKAGSSTFQWITSIKDLNIIQGEQSFLRPLDNVSLAYSLQRLQIGMCKSLQSLPSMIMGDHCLQELSLKYIPSLKSLPPDGLPTSLQRLKIQDCEKLKFLPQESWQCYTSLEVLIIKNSCHSLESFSLGLFPKLEHLEVEGCPNLKTFGQVGDSATLQYLSLHGLPNLELLPQRGLPSKLQSFYIGQYKQDKGDKCERMLHNLLENQLLPSSLVCFYIWNVSNLKLLDGKGFQHLSSLEKLTIQGCPKLESLPEEGLPSSLLLLEIWSCNKLEKRYHFEKGEHLFKIAHIPTIKINNEYYDP